MALAAERLRFTEPWLAVTVSRNDETPQIIHLPRSAAPASCPLRAVEDWLRALITRYEPVVRKVDRWEQVDHAALGADAIRLILARRTAVLLPSRKHR